MSVNGVGGVGQAYQRLLEGEGASDSKNDATQPGTEESVPGTSLLLVDGDIGARVAALAILSAQKQRDSNRDIQLREESALERAEDEQVKAKHEQADDIRMAGLVDGGFGMGSGALTIAGGLSNSEGDRQIFKGAATGSDAIGKGLGSIPRAEQRDDEAKADSYEHEAAHHRRNFDAARDAIRDGQDLLERALDFYKQNQLGEAEVANTSVRRA